MIRALTVLGLLTLAACGADGEPVTPSMNANIALGSSGTSVGVGIGLHKGPFSAGWRIK